MNNSRFGLVYYGVLLPNKLIFSNRVVSIFFELLLVRGFIRYNEYSGIFYKQFFGETFARNSMSLSIFSGELRLDSVLNKFVFKQNLFNTRKSVNLVNLFQKKHFLVKSVNLLGLLPTILYLFGFIIYLFGFYAYRSFLNIIRFVNLKIFRGYYR